MKKKVKCNLILVLLMAFCLGQAQETTTSKFNLIAYGGIGFGIVENDNEPNYNLNINSGEILLNYNISQRVGVATGLGLYELTGNGFNALGNFYHQRSLLKIPVLLTLNSEFSEKISFYANFGFYGHTIIKDEYRFLNGTQEDIYEGWNFGAQFGAGLLFELFDGFSAGINVSGQSDFGKFETNANQGISDKQKIRYLNSMGLIFVVDL